MDYTGPSPDPHRSSNAPTRRGSENDSLRVPHEVLATLNALKAQIAKLEAQLPVQGPSAHPLSRDDDARQGLDHPRDARLPHRDHSPSRARPDHGDELRAPNGRRASGDERTDSAPWDRRQRLRERSPSPSRLTPLAMPRGEPYTNLPGRRRNEAPFPQDLIGLDHHGSQNTSLYRPLEAARGLAARLGSEDRYERPQDGNYLATASRSRRYSASSTSPVRRVSRYARQQSKSPPLDEIDASLIHATSMNTAHRRRPEYPNAQGHSRRVDAGAGRGAGHGRGGYRGRGRGYVRGRGRGY